MQRRNAALLHITILYEKEEEQMQMVKTEQLWGLVRWWWIMMGDNDVLTSLAAHFPEVKPVVNMHDCINTKGNSRRFWNETHGVLPYLMS